MIRIILSLGLLLSYVGAESLKAVEKETRIINGSQVSTNDDTWRFIVSLKYLRNHYCGGSLIAPNWILTAAHCLSDSKGVPYVAVSGDTVGIGSYNFNRTTNYSVKRFIVHPSYDRQTRDNDIGLVELNSYISNVPVVKYDKSHPLSVNTQTKVAGWGNMSTSLNIYPYDLREALTPLVDFNQCNSANSYNGQLTNNMLCAGYFASTRDSCQGDSGVHW